MTPPSPPKNIDHQFHLQQLTLPPNITSTPHSSPPNTTTTTLTTTDDDDISPTTTAPPQPPTLQANATQRKRAEEAYDLHLELDCIPDEALSANITTGKIKTHLTPADVKLMRKLRPVCPCCIEGNAIAPPAPPTTAAPATRPGQHLSYDIQQLHTPAVGGFTHQNTIVDENTGFTSLPGMINKSNQQAFNSIQSTVLTDYNAHKHKVDSVHSDAENVNTSIMPHLNAIGIDARVSIPTHFARQVERIRRTLQQRSRSCHARLPFILPATYNHLAEQSVVYNKNRTLNSRSDPMHPLTPEEAVTGTRSKPPVPFGTVAMVRVPPDKSTARAKAHNQDPKVQPRAEIAISMGHCPKTGGTRWLLANKLVVPRLPISILPRGTIPFNLPRNPTYNILPPLLHSSAPITNTTTIPAPIPATTPTTAIAQQHTNTIVQLPTAPDTRLALTLLTNHTPQQTPELLSELRLNQPRIQPHNNPTTQTAPRPPLLLMPTQQIPQLLPPYTPPTTYTTTTTIPPQDLHDNTQHSPLPLLPSSPPPPTPQPPSSPITTTTTTIITPLKANSSSITTHPTSPNKPTQHIALRRSQRGTAHPDGFWKGFIATAIHSATPAGILTNHQQRKNLLNKQARATHTQFRKENPILDTYNNSPTTIRPTPSSIQSRVFNLRNAIANNIHPAALQRGMNAEFHKTFQKHTCFKLLTPQQLERTAVFIRLLFAIKNKPLKNDQSNVRVRIAGDGAKQPPHTYGDTFAGTSDATQRSFITALILADCATRDCLDRLQVVGFDLESAFINGNTLDRKDTGGIQLVTRIPNSPMIPHEYRDQLAEIVGPLNGLKQSNHIYDQNLIATLASQGYNQLPSAPYIFHKRCPNNPQDYLTLPMNVDDGTIYTTSPYLLSELKSLLVKRYGTIDFIDKSPGMCGVNYTYHPKGISLDMQDYLTRALTTMGMHKIPPTLTPSTADFFKPPTDPTPASPKEAEDFRTANGILIFSLSLRHDYRMEVIHLCKSNDRPTKSDIAKQFHLLRYICGTTGLGPFFSADPTDFPNGVELSASVDVAFNVENGRSRNAHAIKVGSPYAKTSPFVTHSALGSTIALSPAEAEYIAASDTSKKLLYYIQLAEELGFPQTKPSIILEDNASAIKLANSPLIPTKSRHIALKFHHIRDLINRKIVTFHHCITQKMVTDSMTKITPPPLFLYNRSITFPLAIQQLTTQPQFYKPN